MFQSLRPGIKEKNINEWTKKCVTHTNVLFIPGRDSTECFYLKRDSGDTRRSGLFLTQKQFITRKRINKQKHTNNELSLLKDKESHGLEQ